MDARHRRTQGLARVNRLTGWLAGGALVVTGGFAALLAQPRSHTAAPPTGPVGSGVGATSGSSTAGTQGASAGQASQQPLSPPDVSPQPAQSQSQVSTGAS
jgi:hypothetical protein